MKTPKIGRYEIVSELGRGAMGVVYKARDPVLERTVAIKTINMALESDGAEKFEARFQQEARAAGGLNHPNIVTIHDIGKSGSTAYMAMEFIEGAELRTLLQPGKPLALAQAVSVATQIAEGLAYAHEHGVVHRDIKPPNIMVLANDHVKITDFGIARIRTPGVQTQTGMMLGSPKYMSPERVLGRRADHRSDIFSLGIILYEMLAGAAPFDGGNVTALMYQIVNFAPPAPSAVNPAVPDVLDAIVAKMLAKSMDERYQSAAETARDLREYGRSLASAPGAAPGPLAPTFAPGAAPVRVDTDTRAAVLTQSVMLTRRDDGARAPQAAAPEAESPARGLARSFDSAEATQRLAALTLAVLDASMPARVTATQMMRTLERPAWRPWGRRDTFVVAGAALAGIVVAALILRG